MTFTPSLAELKQAVELDAQLDRNGQTLMSAETAGRLIQALVDARAALEYTQRRNVNIGNDGDGSPLLGVPDKIMMRNRCAKALAALDTAFDWTGV